MVHTWHNGPTSLRAHLPQLLLEQGSLALPLQAAAQEVAWLCLLFLEP